MATDDKPRWRLPTVAETKMMTSDGKPIGVMAARDPVTGRVEFIFSVEMVEQLRAANMKPGDFIAEAVARGFVDDIPYFH